MDNVMKRIVKSRSPTMRHVSRTHRVAIDGLFDRINVEPQIQINYVDFNNQLADMPTKGSFTRDEWNHLLHLLNMMDLSMFSCSHFLSFESEANGTECFVEKKARSILRGKWFANGEAKAQANEFGDDEFKIYFMSSCFFSQEKSDFENPVNVEVGKDRVGTST